MDIKASNQAEQAGKLFRRKYFIKEDNDTEAPDKAPERDEAEYKQAQREKKYKKGWINFSVTVPASCAMYLKNAYEKYKESNLKQFEIETEVEPEV